MEITILLKYLKIYSECKKSIRTEKIFKKKTLFLKSKYYPARNESSNWRRIDIDTMISIWRRFDV